MADWYFRGGRPGSGLKACPGCGKLVDAAGEFCPYCARRLRSENGWRALARNFLRRPDAATRILLALLVLAFVLQLAVEACLPGPYRRQSGNGGMFSLLGVGGLTNYLMGGCSARLIFGAREYWRLLSYVFLHAGLLHILFNSWMLLDLGRLVEAARGARETFTAFVWTGIAAGFFSCLYKAVSGQDVVTIGASGSVCGLLGVLLGSECRLRRPDLPTLLQSGLMRSCLCILAFGLIVPGIDNAAHLGGLVSGAAYGYYLPRLEPGRLRINTPRLRAAAFPASVAALAITLLLAAHSGISEWLELSGRLP